MYVGVIRGDLPGPIFLGDLEPNSQLNFPVEPVGQSRYLSRPNPTNLTNFLGGLNPDGLSNGSGGVPAGIEGSSAVTFPLTLTGSNNVLRIQLVAAGPFTAITIATGTYATMATLLVAANTALSGHGASATTDTATGTLFVLQSTAVGVGAYIGVDTVAHGSTFNTPANLADNQNFTMPSAATIITAMNPTVTPPATGSINVSAASILTNLGAAPAAATAVALIAGHFTETLDAVQSFQVGVLSKFAELTYTPDPTRLPVITAGPAIQVVQDDGVSAFSAPLPIITGAVHNSPNTGDITITGSDLGNSEFTFATVVRVTGVSPGPGLQAPYVRLTQKLIANTLTGGTQGSVSATSIVIPASLLTVAGVALGVVGSSVQAEFSTLSNTNYGTAASLTTVTNGVATLTGLAHMNSAMVGGKITLSGCASAANNGTFFIAAFVSATSVTINNLFAVASDGNNGAIVWSQPAPITFVVT